MAFISEPLLGQLQAAPSKYFNPPHPRQPCRSDFVSAQCDQPGFPVWYHYAPTNGAEEAEKVPLLFLQLPSKAAPEGPRHCRAKPADL